jgi:hypothetical protein
MTVNTKLVENCLLELLHCARNDEASEIKILPGGIEITVDILISTPLMRAALSLHECYPEGGVYVTSRAGALVLCVYYKMEV